MVPPGGAPSGRARRGPNRTAARPGKCDHPSVDRRPSPPGARPRPRGWALAALAAALASAGCVHLRGTTEQPAILRFHVEGLAKLDQADLKDRLATQESRHSPRIPIAGPIIHQVAGARERLSDLERPPPIPLVGPGLYAIRGSPKDRMASLLDPVQLDVDKQRVEAYCRDHGYYDARVVDTRIVPVGEGQVEVQLQVEEGEPVRVTQLELEGMEAAPEARAAAGKLALAVGEIFAVEAYDQAREQLLTALHDGGWATAEVSQEAQVLPEEHAALVRYQIQAGPRLRFGPVLVAGASAVPRGRIRELAAEEIRTGEWYSESKLAAAQTKVFGMGVFGGVRVNRGQPDVERGIVPVLVSVREAPFRSVRIGPSLGVLSNSRIDLSAVAGWTHRNFLGDLRKLDLSLSVGYAWVLTSPQKEGPIGTAVADLTQPRVLKVAGRPIDLAARFEIERGLEQAYDFWVERFRFGLPIHLSKRLSLVPSYNLAVYELSRVEAGFNTNDPTSTNPILQSCEGSICLLSYLEQRIEWDGRDDPINTRRGYYAALSVQEGGHVGGYGYQYLRFLPELRGYLPLGPSTVLAARARIGAFVPVNESSAPPTVALFEAGGSSSMRGYGLNRLSPMLCVKKKDPATGQQHCTGEWVPVGGNGLAEYSVELRFPLRGKLLGAVFTDAAYVSRPSAVPTAWRDALSPARLQWAAGFGIRYRTPIGPLRLDLAARLPDDLSPGVELNQRFPAVPSPDGVHREPIAAFHLSVGEAY
jgi:translocation and assembly module TamA